MTYRRGVSIGIANVPVQVFSALFANVIIINEIGKSNLEVWYLLISTMPLFVALELSFPSLMLRNINKTAKTKRVIRKFTLNAISLSSMFQLLVILSICMYLGKVDMSMFLFFLGAYLRTVSNIIISVPYACGLIVHEKIYRVSYASLLPIASIIVFYYSSELHMSWLYILWCFSSMVVFFFALFAYFQSEIHSDDVKKCDIDLSIKIKENLSLLATTIPGLFIFNLSIYYLKAFSSSEDVVTYGFILQLVNVYYLVNNIVPSVIAPKLSKSYFAGNCISKDAIKIVDINICLAILALIVIFFWGGALLEYLFIDTFDVSDIHSILVSVSVFILIESVQVTLTFIGISTGNYNYHYQSFFSACLVTLFSYLFIPTHGYLGLVYSVCLAQILTCLPINSYLVCKHLGVSFLNIFLRWLLLASVFTFLFITHDYIKYKSFIYNLSAFVIILSIVSIVMYRTVFSKLLKRASHA